MSIRATLFHGGFAQYRPRGDSAWTGRARSGGALRLAFGVGTVNGGGGAGGCGRLLITQGDGWVQKPARSDDTNGVYSSSGAYEQEPLAPGAAPGTSMSMSEVGARRPGGRRRLASRWRVASMPSSSASGCPSGSRASRGLPPCRVRRCRATSMSGYAARIQAHPARPSVIVSSSTGGHDVLGAGRTRRRGSHSPAVARRPTFRVYSAPTLSIRSARDSGGWWAGQDAAGRLYHGEPHRILVVSDGAIDPGGARCLRTL